MKTKRMKILKKENENKEMRRKYGGDKYEGSDKTSCLCLTKKRSIIG
jgi:hypothetical protein